MQTTSRKTSEKVRIERKDEPKKAQEEKLKKSVYTISTPREYISKTSASDIYSQKKSTDAKAPRKVPGVSAKSNVSPMKGLLKSSASSISQISKTSDRTPPKKLEARSLYSARSEVKAHSTSKNDTRKKELVTNVTINSPVVKRKLDLNIERVTREVASKKVPKTKEVGNEPRKSKEAKAKEVSSGEQRTKNVAEVHVERLKERGERQRTKTRTLDESEVKILTPNNVDINGEMRNLAQKLVAKPKSFYVELDEEKPKSLPKKEISDEEFSYEDDFESYESDFDSYHSDGSGAKTEISESESEASNERGEQSETNELSAESSVKERDEERMLDSGNFDLRDQRSSRSKPAVMDFILEDTEKSHLEDKKSLDESKKSLDEGFQDMNSSASSMRTVDVLYRPLFIDFSKSKQNKIKRATNARLKQRAKDLLNMISLHEMTYSLFEMEPISYDLYMATFGRSNYTQIGVQTFEDGITEEVQTDDTQVSQKWTQYPVEFSKQDIYLNKDVLARKYSGHTEDYLSKFTFLIENHHDENDSQIKSDQSYKDNPLRVFFEQKDGVGSDEMLPYETYKSKLKSNDYSSNRLSKFLKKVECKVNHILSKNTGGKDFTSSEKSGKLPFSKGHVTISTKSIENPKYSFLKSTHISKVIFSETKSTLIMTFHKKLRGVDGKKCLICLWELSVAREPIKILHAIDEVVVGKFRGNTDGIFVAALQDGSIHLWDLSEEPSWCDSVATEKKSPNLAEVEERLTQTEKDREWNLNNSKTGFQQPAIPLALQSCAFTSSAINMSSAESSDCIVGLELMTNQIVSLQRIGILTIWSIIQEKKTSKDIGKAFWSKMRMEKHQTINISEHIDTTIKENTNFNLNSAKRRISQRKQEKNFFKKESSRPKTASKFDFDIDRPYSAASLRKKVPVDINVPKSWENGIVCNDLKVVCLNNVNSFLVAKNGGEVVCCKRCLGVVRIERFCVATDTSSITSLDVSSEGVPYFLAASDNGTLSLCSLLDARVILTLDCRNLPTLPDVVDKCHSDHKGRFVSSVAKSTLSNDGFINKLEIQSVHWSRVNHCCVFVLLRNEALLMFDLTHSDINARFASDKAASQAAIGDHTLALLCTTDELQIHKLTNEDSNKEYLHLFNKYVTLL